MLWFSVPVSSTCSGVGERLGVKGIGLTCASQICFGVSFIFIFFVSQWLSVLFADAESCTIQNTHPRDKEVPEPCSSISHLLQVNPFPCNKPIPAVLAADLLVTAIFYSWGTVLSKKQTKSKKLIRAGIIWVLSQISRLTLMVAFPCFWVCLEFTILLYALMFLSSSVSMEWGSFEHIPKREVKSGLTKAIFYWLLIGH